MSKFDFKISKEDDKVWLEEQFEHIAKSSASDEEHLTYSEFEDMLLTEFNNLKNCTMQDLEVLYEELGDEVLHTTKIEKLYGFYSRLKKS